MKYIFCQLDGLQGAWLNKNACFIWHGISLQVESKLSFLKPVTELREKSNDRIWVNIPMSEKIKIKKGGASGTESEHSYRPRNFLHLPFPV